MSLKPGEANLGTTIMAVAFDGGVVIGSDSRTTTGSYISNRVTDKLGYVHDRIYCCRSGSAADTQAIVDMVRYYAEMYSVMSGEPPSVRTTAALFQEICYQNKDMLIASIIVAGWDKHSCGSVWTIPIGASLHKQSYAIGGSGSTYIYGFCDSQYKEKMTRKECVEFVKNAVSLAMARDGSSGGIIRLAVIDEKGVEKIFVPEDELPTYWKE